MRSILSTLFEKLFYRSYGLRLLFILGVSVLGAAAFNEFTYQIQKEDFDRAPQTVRLVIPAGTAERVEAGESVPSIPAEMVFVMGDVLEVVNEDNSAHQLGPILVPPGATGRLVMEQASSYAYSCSFQSTRYLGIDVRQATTLGTRFTGLVIAAPTTTALLFLYSLLVFPLRPLDASKVELAAGDNAGNNAAEKI